SAAVAGKLLDPRAKRTPRAPAWLKEVPGRVSFSSSAHADGYRHRAAADRPARSGAGVMDAATVGSHPSPRGRAHRASRPVGRVRPAACRDLVLVVSPRLFAQPTLE